MFFYVGLVVLAIVLWQLYSSVYKPYKAYKQYITAFRERGYKVLELGFMPFFSQYILDSLQGAKKHQDAQYICKHVYSQYDVGVANFFSKPMLVLVNEELLKDFYANEIVHQ